MEILEGAEEAGMIHWGRANITEKQVGDQGGTEEWEDKKNSN
jgi:hypothetical protein